MRKLTCARDSVVATWSPSLSFSRQVAVLHEALVLRELNPSGAETAILWTNCVNTMAADVLAPCVTSPSVSILLTMLVSRPFIFHLEAFQLPAPS